MMGEIKEQDRGWQDGMAKSITFIVTKDCQLACKYCYLVGKNTKERLTWEVAKEAIDYILDREDEFREESVIWDFIGGEPFLEIELIDKICDYLKTEMYRREHHWFNSYRFSFSTNGINYHTEKVQRFIEKNHNHLSIGILTGLSGSGIDVTMPVHRLVTVRTGYSGLHFGDIKFKTINTAEELAGYELVEDDAVRRAQMADKIELAAKPNFWNVFLLAEVHPFTNESFHFTAGLYFGSKNFIHFRNNRTDTLKHNLHILLPCYGSKSLEDQLRQIIDIQGYNIEFLNFLIHFYQCQKIRDDLVFPIDLGDDILHKLPIQLSRRIFLHQQGICQHLDGCHGGL